MTSEWKECTLAELGEFVGGATPSTKDESNYGGDIAWITPKDLSTLKGRFVAHGERNITEKGLNSCSTQMMPANAVLFSSRAPIGYVAIAKNPVCTNQGFKSIVANEDNDPMFLYYLLKYNKDAIEAMGSGTTFKEVSGSTMRGIRVRVPVSKAEQQRIASVLATLDSKIENNDKINDNLELQAAALIDRYQTTTDTVITLHDIMDFENGFAFQSSTYLAEGAYRIITIKNVQDGRIDSDGAAYIDSIPPRMKNGCRLHIGDALLSLTGNVGRAGIVCEENLLLNQRVAKIVPHNPDLLPFLYFVYRLPSTKVMLESIAKGTAQLNLSPVETLKLTIPFDHETAIQLSRNLAPVYRAIVVNNQESIALAHTRDSLLPKLMSGEIDVSDIQL